MQRDLGEDEHIMKEKIVETMVADGAEDFEQFLHNNRNKVDIALNRILWYVILVGPAIALGILAGVFKRTSYSACVVISVSMLIWASVDKMILKRMPHSFVPGILALGGMELLICFMNCSHISIRLSWFLVPLLSLLFCDAKAYIGVSILNYIVMGISTWLEAAHYAEIRTDFATPLGGFINIFAGCTIEALVMFAAGYALGKATNGYYRMMIGKYKEAQIQHEQVREQLQILESMAEIYDFVNLIDFTESTEMSLREKNLRKLVIKKGQDHTHMTQGLRGQIVPDMVDDFWAFTDITTVPKRLINRRSIAGEFINIHTGWFRAQYIRVKGEMNRRPDVVIYTIQNIDSDKRKEEHLIRISMTDELTRLFNRRCYEEDIAEIEKKGLGENLALISADVNGLKAVNDKMGHAAGDELIIGAATCLLSAIGAYGNAYRTGGDEFMAIVHTSDCEALVRDIQNRSAAWHGAMVKGVSISVGYASHADYPDATIAELETISDQRMYEDKDRYYQRSGKNRRQE